MIADAKRLLFLSWLQNTIPFHFDETLTLYEIVAKLSKYINDLRENMVLFEKDVNKINDELNELEKISEYLSKECEKIKNGEYTEMYIDSLSKWIDKNLITLVGRIVKFVAFGLDDDGYFYADIPETWGFLEFSTVMNTESEDYGKLILSW